MRKKIAVSMLVLSALIAITLPPIAQAYTKLDLDIPEVASGESVSEGKYNLMVEPVGAFDLPPEIKAKMSKEELYELQAIPGYFKPKQVSVPDGQMLLTNPQPVKAVVCVDEEMRAFLAMMIGYPTAELCPWELVYQWGEYILESGDDPLESSFGIDIQMEFAVNWDTPDNLYYNGLLSMIGGVDPTGVGCDIIVLMTGQEDPSCEGIAYQLGRHFVMDATEILNANLFQHEATHLFGPGDHGYDLGIFCIMSYSYTWVYRGYCGPCTTNINEHRFRFE